MKMLILAAVVDICSGQNAIMFYLDGVRDNAEAARAYIVDMSKCSSSKTEDAFQVCFQKKLNIQVKRLAE